MLPLCSCLFDASLYLSKTCSSSCLSGLFLLHSNSMCEVLFLCLFLWHAMPKLGDCDSFIYNDQQKSTLEEKTFNTITMCFWKPDKSDS